MEREVLETVADRILAWHRGERAVDPAQQEGLACLLSLVERRCETRGGRRGRAVEQDRRELLAALTELATENQAVDQLIQRLARPAAGWKVRRPRVESRPRDVGNTVTQHLGQGAVGIVGGRDVRVGDRGELATLIRAARALGAEGGVAADLDPDPAEATPASAPSEDDSTPYEGIDLELRVRQTSDVGGVKLEVEIVVYEPGGKPIHHQSAPRAMPIEPERLIRRLFEQIQRSTGPRLESDLAAIGGELSRRLLSDELAGVLWNLRQHDRTLLLRSNEPWIPWELSRLRSPSGVLGPSLCESFSMSRWLDGYRKPASELQLRRIGVVASRSSGQAVREELEDLLDRDGAARSVQRVPARYESLIKALAAGGYDGWHFCGHGIGCEHDPDAAFFALEGHRRFTARDLSGDARGCGRSSPLVFLNGCHTGRGGWALTGIGGWAEQFLAAGAGAFIGTLWAIDGPAASSFARAFYDRFCDQGVPFAKAVRQARESIRQRGDASWLAYVAYGHPRAGL